MSIGDEVDFSQAILEEARQEAEGIVDLARREAERILDGARDELEKIYIAEAPETKKQQASIRYNQIIASAELETRQKVLLAQEHWIQQIQEQVRERLQHLRDDTRYPQILQKLIHEGIQELEGESLEILVAQEDHHLVTPEKLQDLQQQTGKTLRLAEQAPNSIVGAIVQHVDKHVVCDNSFQAIIQREQPRIRLLIARTLFGEID